MDVSVTPTEARLLNSVFLAVIEEAASQRRNLSPTTICRRVYPLFNEGERSFETLKSAALRVDDVQHQIDRAI